MYISNLFLQWGANSYHKNIKTPKGIDTFYFNYNVDKTNPDNNFDFSNITEAIDSFFYEKPSVDIFYRKTEPGPSTYRYLSVEPPPDRIER